MVMGCEKRYGCDIVDCIGSWDSGDIYLRSVSAESSSQSWTGVENSDIQLSNDSPASPYRSCFTFPVC